MAIEAVLSAEGDGVEMLKFTKDLEPKTGAQISDLHLKIPQTAVKLGVLDGMPWPSIPSVRVQ